MPVKSKAMIFPPDYKTQPGVNDAQRHADAFSWEVPVEMLTKGKSLDLGEGGGPNVGSPFDGDAMGEQRNRITWQSDKVSKGKP